MPVDEKSVITFPLHLSNYISKEITFAILMGSLPELDRHWLSISISISPMSAISGNEPILSQHIMTWGQCSFPSHLCHYVP